MRAILLASLLWVGTTLDTTACTVYTTTHNGRTLIGNNEDAWSINAQVRFVQGRNGEYGAIYFDHFNGHPLRSMGPQLGINEAGLVFDGLTIQPQHATPVRGRKQVRFDELMPLLMRTCSTVHEAAAVLRVQDFSWLTRSMLFFADRNGDYLIVENDTMILGNDPDHAVGNWRMGKCTDPDAIPIPRLQAGRALLAAGTDASVEHGTAVLQSMVACRPKLGEGTLFSTLFDPQQGEVHLFFYHDFNERVTFHLKTELAKGDRRVEMASLFGARPEYDALVAYITPFHQGWLFRVLIGWAAMMGLVLLLSAVGLLRALVLRFRRHEGDLATPLLHAFAGVLALSLLGILLTQEGVYYFGLGDLHPLLTGAPLVLVLLLALLVRYTQGKRVLFRAVPVLLFAPLIACLAYWGMLWPW